MIHIEIVNNPKKELEEFTLEKMFADSRENVHFMTVRGFEKIFTPERIRLLKYLNNHDVESISDLAKHLGRKFEAVHRDIRYLKPFSAVKIKTEGKRKIPKSGGKIQVRIV